MSRITIRPVTDDEYPAFVTAFMEGFSEDVESETMVDGLRQTLPAERTLAAFDGDEMVGTFGGFDLTLTVPGGTLPMEGTTVVTVFPTHRRMGLLRSMMKVHLDNAVDAGYAIAGLWASESNIYGRFGYGHATSWQAYKFPTPPVALRDDIAVDRVRRVSRDEAGTLFPPVYEQALARRPGMFSRSEAWWNREVFLDEEWMRRGRTKKRFVVHNGPDGIDGYAMYRQKAAHADDGHDNGTVMPIEVTALTPRAHASLWSYLIRVDGCPNVEMWNVPLDDPLPWMVREPRRITISRRGDALWIRVLDVAAALEARSYEHDGEIIMALTDPFRPDTDGTYRLAVDDGVGRVDPSAASADVAMDIDVLGALYLGGQDAYSYAAAHRITGSPEAVDRLHRLFRTAKPPWCNEVF